LGATTAWSHQPDKDSPESSGSPLVDLAELKARIIAADEADLRLSVHAVGDKAIDELIVMMQEISADEINTKRYRIEHFQHPSSRAIRAVAHHGIIVSMQPYHAIDDGRRAEKRIGADRIETTYAFRSIIDAGRYS
jgi:predicted amidohydrolase YtcJ